MKESFNKIKKSRISVKKGININVLLNVENKA